MTVLRWGEHILAFLGALWIVLTVFFAVSDNAKGKSKD